VIREISDGVIAAPVAGDDLMPDHKLSVIPCASHREAERLAAVLESPVVNFLVRSFALSTSLTGSFLRYVGIRDLQALPETSTAAEDMAQALGLNMSEYERLAGASEGEATNA
jgi:hypothetical protein